VSPSYVSKIKSGNKSPNIYIPKPIIINVDDFAIYEDDLEAMRALLESRRILTGVNDVKEFVEGRITYHLTQAKIYTEIAKKLKED